MGTKKILIEKRMDDKHSFKIQIVNLVTENYPVSEKQYIMAYNGRLTPIPDEGEVVFTTKKQPINVTDNKIADELQLYKDLCDLLLTVIETLFAKEDI